MYSIYMSCSFSLWISLIHSWLPKQGFESLSTILALLFCVNSPLTLVVEYYNWMTDLTHFFIEHLPHVDWLTFYSWTGALLKKDMKIWRNVVLQERFLVNRKKKNPHIQYPKIIVNLFSYLTVHLFPIDGENFSPFFIIKKLKVTL